MLKRFYMGFGMQMQGDLTVNVVLTKQDKQRFRELTAAANVATKERRYDDALGLYDDALAINPDDAKAIEKRAKVLPYTTNN